MRTASNRYRLLAISVSCRSQLTFIATAEDRASMWKKSTPSSFVESSRRTSKVGKIQTEMYGKEVFMLSEEFQAFAFRAREDTSSRISRSDCLYFATLLSRHVAELGF